MRLPVLFIGIFLTAVAPAAVIIVPQPAAADQLISADQALKKIFPKAEEFIPATTTLTAGQIQQVEASAQLTFAGSHSNTIQQYEARAGGVTIGHAYEDTVMGKWGLIRYLTGVSPEGRVEQVVVLDYQEIRGKPVAKKRFLRQYKGKSRDDPLQLQRDINGITGATISSRSLTEGVRKILHIHQLLRNTP